MFPQELMRLGHCSLPNQCLQSSVEPGGLIRNKPQEDFSRITTAAGIRMDPVPSHTIQLFRTRCPGSVRSGPDSSHRPPHRILKICVPSYILSRHLKLSIIC